MSYQRWKRPDFIQFPSVWSTFNGRKQINGVIPKFRIQDIPVEQFENVIELMANGFLRDEPLCKSINLVGNEASVEDYRRMWRYVLPDKLGLVCYLESGELNNEKPIIAGVNVTHIIRKDDPELQNPNGLQTKKVVDSLKYLLKQKDFYKELNVDKYLNGLGLYVVPEFRGQGISLELIKAREPLCRAVGIKTTLTCFSTIGTQKPAEKLGFKDFVATTYENLRVEKPEFDFPGVEVEAEADSLRFMYLSYS